MKRVQGAEMLVEVLDRLFTTGHVGATKPVFERLVLMPDGAFLSVQASHGHYCAPRTDDGPWTSVEYFCTCDEEVQGWSTRSSVEAHAAGHGWEEA